MLRALHKQPVTIVEVRENVYYMHTQSTGQRELFVYIYTRARTQANRVKIRICAAQLCATARTI